MERDMKDLEMESWAKSGILSFSFFSYFRPKLEEADIPPTVQEPSGVFPGENRLENQQTYRHLISPREFRGSYIHEASRQEADDDLFLNHTRHLGHANPYSNRSNKDMSREMLGNPPSRSEFPTKVNTSERKTSLADVESLAIEKQ